MVATHGEASLAATAGPRGNQDAGLSMIGEQLVREDPEVDKGPVLVMDGQLAGAGLPVRTTDPTQHTNPDDLVGEALPVRSADPTQHAIPKDRVGVALPPKGTVELVTEAPDPVRMATAEAAVGLGVEGRIGAQTIQETTIDQQEDGMVRGGDQAQAVGWDPVTEILRTDVVLGIDAAHMQDFGIGS